MQTELETSERWRGDLRSDRLKRYLKPPDPGQAVPERFEHRDLEVRLLRPGDHHAAAELCRRCSIPAPELATWEWRFFGVPKELRMALGAFDEEEGLIGLYPAILRPIRIHGRDAVAVNASGTCVDPGSRWGGRVFRLLTQSLRERAEALGVAVGFGGGTSEAALHVGERLTGYRLLHSLETFEYRLSLRPALSRRLGILGDALAGAVDRVRQRHEPEGPGRIELESRAPSATELDQLWTRLRDEHQACLVRDSIEFRWRWQDCPFTSPVLGAWRKERFEGYLVLRFHQDEGVRIATIVDLFAADAEIEEALLDAAMAHARKLGREFLRIAPSPAMASHRLVRESPDWRPAREAIDHVVYRPLHPNPALFGLDASTDPEKLATDWYYTQGDSDFGD